ncbi:MAG TPA: hypothetical protein VF092_19485 [Longimicrobium sp.]
MKTRILALAAAVLALAACEQSLTVSEQALQGTWRADEHFHDPGTGPQDAWAELTFGPGSRYQADYYSYGGYGRAADVLTYHYRAEGEYRLRGDSLDVRLFRELSQDVQFPETNFVHTLDGDWQRNGTVAVDGDRLTRRYLTAPADAPELTIATYTRVQD